MCSSSTPASSSAPRFRSVAYDPSAFVTRAYPVNTLATHGRESIVNVISQETYESQGHGLRSSLHYRPHEVQPQHIRRNTARSTLPPRYRLILATQQSPVHGKNSMSPSGQSKGAPGKQSLVKCTGRVCVSTSGCFPIF